MSDKSEVKVVSPEESQRADELIKSNIKREARSLELKKETWTILENLKSSLNHEDLEETLTVLADIGVKMVQLTTVNDRTVKIMSGVRTELQEACPTCHRKPVSYTRESAVKLGQEIPSKKVS